MKKNIILVLFFCTGLLYSQEKTKAEAAVIPELKSDLVLNVNYTKRSMLQKDQEADNWKMDGNNFYGFSFGQNIRLNKGIGIEYEFNVQFGNIYGSTSSFLSFKPFINIGSYDLYYVKFGAGPSFLTAKENLAKYGGYGVSASVGMGLTIYRGFGVYYDYGYEGYGNSNYNSYSIGIRYSPKD